MSFRFFPTGTECSFALCAVISLHSQLGQRALSLQRISKDQESTVHHCQNTLYLNNIFQKQHTKIYPLLCKATKFLKIIPRQLLQPLYQCSLTFLAEILFQTVSPGFSLYKDSFKSSPGSSSFNQSCVLKAWQTSNVL